MDESTADGASAILGHAQKQLHHMMLQSEFYLPLTNHLFVDAGFRPGMRVLDFGCGGGDLAFLAAKFVSPGGSVVGIDRSPAAIELAGARAQQAGIDHLSFYCGDEDLIEHLSADQPFDAAIGRLILMYQPDPAQTLQKVVRGVREGGIVAFQEVNLASMGVSYPEIPLARQVWGWMLAACRRADIEINMGFKLHGLFNGAGLPEPRMVMSARVEGSDDSDVYEFAAETARALLPIIEDQGIATAAQLDVDTLADRLRDETLAHGGVLVPSFLVSAWSYK